jgi:hypothetical protein
MKPLKLCMMFVTGGLLVSCAGGAITKPTETAVSDKPFVIEVPKGLTGEESLLKGVKINNYKRFKGKAPVLDFFSVNMIEHPDTSELTTEICRGDYYSSTRDYDKSCIFYDAKVSITEKTSSYTIVITTYKLRTKQGKNSLFFPIDLPKTGINRWYDWIARQTIEFSDKVTSRYPSVSIKGNFDRKFDKYPLTKKSDADLKQFKDAYVLPTDGDTYVYVAAAFYPYREGSLVELEYRASDYNRNGGTSADWVSIVKKAKSAVKRVVSE